MGEAKNIYFTCFKSSSSKATNTSSNIYLYNSDRLYPKYGSYPEFFWHVWKRVYRHSRECSSRRNYISEWKAQRLMQIKSESLSSARRYEASLCSLLGVVRSGPFVLHCYRNFFIDSLLNYLPSFMAPCVLTSLLAGRGLTKMIRITWIILKLLYPMLLKFTTLFMA